MLIKNVYTEIMKLKILKLKFPPQIHVYYVLINIMLKVKYVLYYLNM